MPFARDAYAAPLNESFTFSGVKGTERILTPAASKIAFEIADGMTAADGSPAPQGFSIRTIDKLDNDVRRLRESEDRISHPIDACHPGAVELKSSIRARLTV